MKFARIVSRSWEIEVEDKMSHRYYSFTVRRYGHNWSVTGRGGLGSTMTMREDELDAMLLALQCAKEEVEGEKGGDC